MKYFILGIYISVKFYKKILYLYVRIEVVCDWIVVNDFWLNSEMFLFVLISLLKVVCVILLYNLNISV